MSIDNLRASIDDVASALTRILPEGCPMVLGGGIARDALMGGVPVDIDVWLPSNFDQRSSELRYVGDFSNYMRSEGLTNGQHPQIVFTGPNDLDPANDPNNYRDMSNHWVIEFDHGLAKFNIMRTMTQWTGDSQAFFSEIMQNFDIDLCMMFVANIPTEFGGFFHTPVDTIILPNTIADDLANGDAITTFRWNQFRHTTTSVARRDFRAAKIVSRYQVTEGIILPREHFQAVPVPLAFVMENQALLPFPQRSELADLRTTRAAEAQGFRSVEEMNEALTVIARRIRRFEDAVAVLSRGDLTGDFQEAVTELAAAGVRAERQLGRERERLHGVTPQRTGSLGFGRLTGTNPWPAIDAGIHITHNPMPTPWPVLQAGGGVGVDFHGTLTGMTADLIVVDDVVQPDGE